MRAALMLTGGLLAVGIAGKLASPAMADAPATRLGASVNQGLAERAQALDARERQLQLREATLAGLQARLAQQADELRRQQAALAQVRAARRAEQDAKLDAVARLYAAMRPKEAARLMDGLAPELRAAVAGRMKERALAPVMAAMDPANAARLTAQLAQRPASPPPAAN